MQDNQDGAPDEDKVGSEANSGFSAESTQNNLPQVEPISWSAPEFVANHKPKSWFMTLGLIVVVFSAVVYLITRSIFSTGAVFILGIVFGIVAGRQPRTLDFTVSNEGVGLGDRFHPYSEFKSFSVYDEGQMSSISLNPFKRFSPPSNIYFEQTDESKIVELLGNYLPNEPASKDPIDKLMHKVRY